MAGAALLAGGLSQASPAGAHDDPGAVRSGVRSTTGSDALLFVPYEGTTAVSWRNGAKSTKTVPATDWTVTGAFSDDSTESAFLYNPGSGPDGLLRTSTAGAGPLALGALQSAPVGGDFRPLVGDFNGDGITDIFWYAAGTAADYLWLFNASGGHTSRTLSVNGTYRPYVAETDYDILPGDDDDYTDDIIWYAPGAGADSIWDFDQTGGHSTRSITLGGNYIAVTGYFGGPTMDGPSKGIIWYDQNGADYLWRFKANGTHTSQALPNQSGDREPIVGYFTDGGGESVLWYRPGSASETLWRFNADGSVAQLESPQVNGTYVSAVGDFNGDGYDDIAWKGSTTATLWNFNGGGYSQQTITGLPAGSLVNVIRSSKK
ncbi:FG-GAP repeat protein [Aquihabitans sp. G128]|uniref:FG-GAP repeat protein n=1 Tax=Aquihabitans sp. G128 TaxID=2849779 RepID=UPI001C217119|nr:FG-GAP repeat protein [Aquihabitans sp. G128]QXC61054.1 FG-GAP repeat protein [Aquihabitans sp. G128]